MAEAGVGSDWERESEKRKCGPSCVPKKLTAFMKLESAILQLRKRRSLDDGGMASTHGVSAEGCR